MACCYGNIYKIKLLPQKIKKPVTTDDSTRDYDTLVKSLNFRKLEITPDLQKIGNSEHHSHARLKLLIYGYS